MEEPAPRKIQEREPSADLPNDATATLGSDEGNNSIREKGLGEGEGEGDDVKEGAAGNDERGWWQGAGAGTDSCHLRYSRVFN